MKIKHPFVVGVITIVGLGVLGVLTFAAGGIVGRHNATPLVTIVDVADAQVVSLVNALRDKPQNVDYFTSGYYHLKLQTYPALPTDSGDAVAFAPVNDDYLIARRNGNLLVASIEDDQIQVRSVEAKVPTNKSVFLEDAQDENWKLRVQFGVKDIFIHSASEGARLYATFHHWKQDQQCAVLRLAAANIQVPKTPEGELQVGDWQTLFDTQPCMALDNGLDKDNEDSGFLQAGGRLAAYQDSQLLMTVGDHFHEGLHNDDWVSDPETSYGKILLIDPSTGSAGVFSYGHRNPQGLYVDSAGNVWATEHGPRGGDELNLVQEGKHYGWPHVVYGTGYHGVEWPEGFDWAGHEGYTKPVYAWVPSIATNNIIRLEKSPLPLWEGNLVVASLADRAIHRLTVADKRVVISERIPIGSRVRDLMQTEDGLMLLTDDGELISITAPGASGDVQTPELRAARLWARCDSCHSLRPNAGHGVGPNLHGFIGREIAGAENYDYSQALRSLEGRWTREELDAFLADPQAFAPGTAMAFPGLKDPEDRDLLINYLRSQTSDFNAGLTAR